MKTKRSVWGVLGSGYRIEIYEHEDHHIEIECKYTGPPTGMKNYASLHMSIEEAVDLFNGDTGKALQELYNVRKTEGQI